MITFIVLTEITRNLVWANCRDNDANYKVHGSSNGEKAWYVGIQSRLRKTPALSQEYAQDLSDVDFRCSLWDEYLLYWSIILGCIDIKENELVIVLPINFYGSVLRITDK